MNDFGNSNPDGLTRQHYFLKCEVFVKDVTYLDVQSKGSDYKTEQLVFLVPLESSQRNFFLDAWLPEYLVSENVEVGIRAAYPIHGYFRACLKRPNKIIDKPHIFVMSRGAEEEFKNLCRAQKGFIPIIEIETIGVHEEDLLDSMKDYELPNKKQYDSPDLTSKNAY